MSDHDRDLAQIKRLVIFSVVMLAITMILLIVAIGMRLR